MLDRYIASLLRYNGVSVKGMSLEEMIDVAGHCESYKDVKSWSDTQLFFQELSAAFSDAPTQPNESSESEKVAHNERQLAYAMANSPGLKAQMESQENADV